MSCAKGRHFCRGASCKALSSLALPATFVYADAKQAEKGQAIGTRVQQSSVHVPGMTSTTLPLLVFSDLDGTLLDHQSYDWSPARPALDRLRALGAGVVLASSKTAAEMTELRRAMALDAWPAIVENGAGLIWPDDGLDGAQDGAQDGTPGDYARLRAALAHLPPGFRGFGDMTAQEVARITGLDPDAAQRARTRHYSEPGLWTGDPADRTAFLDAARAAGLTAREGGRFLTLSFGRTKADAMAEVCARLNPARTIALGDAPNDAEMLQAADKGVLIANPAAPPMPPDVAKTLMRTTSHGPQGWCDAILTLTQDM